MDNFLELQAILKSKEFESCLVNMKIDGIKSASNTCTIDSLSNLLAYVFPKNVAIWNPTKKIHELVDGTPVQFSGSTVFASIEKHIKGHSCRFLNLTKVMGKITMAYCLTGGVITEKVQRKTDVMPLFMRLTDDVLMNDFGC
jgi:hypothetical protein